MNQFISHLQANWHYYLQNLHISSVVECFLFCYFIFVLGARKKNRGISQKELIYFALFAAYITLVFSITLFGRKESIEDSIHDAMTSFSLLITGNINIFFDVLFNFIMFIPAGIFLSMKIKTFPTIILIIFATCTIETIQLISGRGLFEYMDIGINTLGGLAGIIVYHFAKGCYNIQRKRKQ